MQKIKFFFFYQSFLESNFFVRFFREISLSRRIASLVDFTESDVLYVSAPSIFLVPWFRRKKKSCFLIVDIRDLVWEYLLQGNIIHKISGYIFKRMVLNSISEYHLITVTNESEFQYMRSFFPDKPLKLLSNGIDYSRFTRIQDKMKGHSSKRYTISYIGNIGIPQNLASLLHIAKRMPDAYFIIGGDGADKERLMRIVAEMGLENVEFTGYLNWESVPEIYSSSDVLYAKLDPAYIYAVPSKLYEYLSTGLPIVYEGEGAAARLLQHFENVCIVQNGDEEQLFKSFSEARTLGTFSGANIQQIKENYIRDDIFKKFSEELSGELDSYRNKQNEK